MWRRIFLFDVSNLKARFAAAVGSSGTKALLDTDSPYTTIPMVPEVVRLGEPPTSLIEVLPAVNRPLVYRYMRQTTRTNTCPRALPRLQHRSHGN
ncbi:MAG: hypothetical protein M3360_02975 [Actinomycetota bacterium]|nr:hypothetical protein [Actinomycetota bacterium]